MFYILVISVRRRAPGSLQTTILLQFLKSLPSHQGQSTRARDVQAVAQRSGVRRRIRSSGYCRKRTGLERDEFGKRPAYLEALKREDLSGCSILKTDSVTWALVEKQRYLEFVP